MSDQSTAEQVVYKENPKFPGYRFGDDGSLWSRWRPTGKPEYKQIIGTHWKRLKPMPRAEDGRIEIRRIGKPLKQHAQKYGVSEALVSAIIKRKVWQHV